MSLGTGTEVGRRRTSRSSQRVLYKRKEPVVVCSAGGIESDLVPFDLGKRFSVGVHVSRGRCWLACLTWNSRMKARRCSERLRADVTIDMVVE